MTGRRYDSKQIGQVNSSFMSNPLLYRIIGDFRSDVLDSNDIPRKILVLSLGGWSMGIGPGPTVPDQQLANEVLPKMILGDNPPFSANGLARELGEP